MTKAQYLGLALVSVTMLCGRPSPAKEWTPDPSMQAKLTGEQQAGMFTIRAPKGWIRQEKDGSNGETGVAWVTEPRTDASHCYMMLTYEPALQGDTRPLDELIQDYIPDAAKGKSDFVVTPPQDGTISGTAFARVYWKGTGRDGRKMHGFIYTSHFGDVIVEINSQDLDTYRTRTLPLAEAAAMTFRRD